MTAKRKKKTATKRKKTKQNKPKPRLMRRADGEITGPSRSSDPEVRHGSVLIQLNELVRALGQLGQKPFFSDEEAEMVRRFHLTMFRRSDTMNDAAAWLCRCARIINALERNLTVPELDELMAERLRRELRQKERADVLLDLLMHEGHPTVAERLKHFHLSREEGWDRLLPKAPQHRTLNRLEQLIEKPTVPNVVRLWQEWFKQTLRQNSVEQALSRANQGRSETSERV